MKYITQDWTSTKDGYLFLFKDYKKCCFIIQMILLKRLFILHKHY